MALHKADQCPSGEKDIILDSSQLGLQIHESIGHPIELDRVCWYRSQLRRHEFPDRREAGTLKYASDIVNVVADATPAHGPGLGTFAYDDEGVPAQCTPIIKDGLFVGYLSSRETALAVGLQSVSGAMRAESWNRIPLIRMTNVSILPGTWKPDDLIADTDDGIYMETNRAGRLTTGATTSSLVPKSDGRFGRKENPHAEEPQLRRHHHRFLEFLRRRLRPEYWTLWGTPNCGKGQPMQTMGTGHGASPARFRKVQVGAALRKVDFVHVAPPFRRRFGFLENATRQKSASLRGPAVAAAHQLGPDELRRLAEKIFELSEAEETEVEVGAATKALTRFANNADPRRTLAEENYSLSVRVNLDGRTARATTNKTDDESLKRVAWPQAEALARVHIRMRT